MHKVYAAQITKFGPPAVVVVAAFQNAGGYFKAESFCKFPAPHDEQSHQSFRFDQKSFQDTPVKLDDDFMLDEALAQARIDIGLHIEKHFSTKAFLIPQNELQLKEVGVRHLIHLHVRGEAGFLSDIRNKTNCEELRAEIELIQALPPISRGQL